MSYAGAERSRVTSRPYGYATYASSRAPPPGGPARASATVTTAVVGSRASSRSASATQFGLLDYDALDTGRSTSRQSDDVRAPASTWRPLRGGGATSKGSKKSASSSRAASGQPRPPLSRAELREQVRRDIERAARVMDESDSVVSSETEGTARPEASQERRGRSASPNRGTGLVATPMPDLDRDRNERSTATGGGVNGGVAVYDPSRPTEVSVEYTTRLLRRDDDETHNRSHASIRSSPGKATNRSGGGGRNHHDSSADSGAMLQYASPRQEHDTEDHFVARHPVAMTPVPVPVSFDGAQQHQFDRIERGMDRVVAVVDASVEAVQKLKDDTLHRDAVRRAAEEERDVANAANLERLVGDMLATLSDRVDTSADGRHSALKACFENVAHGISMTVETEARRIMADGVQRRDELARGLRDASQAIAEAAAQEAGARMLRSLVADSALPGALEGRLRDAVVQAHRETVAQTTAAVERDVAEAVRTLTADRAAAAVVSDAEGARRLEALEQRVVNTISAEVARARELTVASAADDAEAHAAKLLKAVNSSSNTTLESIRATAEGTQTVVEREAGRTRAEVTAALAETRRLAQDAAEARAGAAAVAKQSIAEHEQQAARQAATESALERHHRDVMAAIEAQAQRSSERLVAVVQDQLPTKLAAGLGQSINGHTDHAASQLTTAVERSGKQCEQAVEQHAQATSRELQQKVPPAVAAALRPLLEAELAATAKHVREIADATAEASLGRMERMLDSGHRALQQHVERSTEAVGRATAADVVREITTMSDTTGSERLRATTQAIASASEATQRALTQVIEQHQQRSAAHVDHAVDRAIRELDDAVTSACSAAVSKAAGESGASARAEALSNIEGAVAKAFDKRLQTGVTEPLARLQDTVRDTLEADRRARDSARRREADEVASLLRRVSDQVQRVEATVTESRHEDELSTERARRQTELAKVRAGQTVTRVREAFEDADGEHQRALDEILAAVSEHRAATSARIDKAGKALQDQRAAHARDAAEWRSGVAAVKEELSELTDGLRTLRSERESVMRDVDSARAAMTETLQRKAAAEAEARAAEQRLEAALDGAAQAERDAAAVQGRLQDLQAQEGAAKAELARLQAQVSSVATLREVMLRDVQRLNASGLTSVSTHAPSVARSGASRHSATATPNPQPARSSDPHEM